MATQTAIDAAEQLSNDGHTVTVSDDEKIVRIEDTRGGLGICDIPSGWRMVMLHDNGCLHLMEE